MIELQILNGTTYKYERKPICDEMPLVKLKAKKWFLWRLSLNCWLYQGYWDTKAEMMAFMTGLEGTR